MTVFHAVFLAAALGLPVAAHAQQPNRDPERGYASRQVLDELLNNYELSAESPGYSEVLRAVAQQEAERVRARLDRGDFQIGDRIWLLVEREEVLTDTFTVVTGPAITLPDIGLVPLAGILRSEVHDHVTSHIARYVRDPVVQVQPLVRISVLGGVGAPGFYTVPSDALLTDALMSAGGPVLRAKLDEIRIERAGRPILRGRAVQDALAAGYTLDQLGIQAGDRIIVPERSGGLGGMESPLRALGFLVSLPALIFGLTRIF